MTDNPKFDFGDEVQVTGGEHQGRVGCVVSINLLSPLGTYTVEFGDGSDAEIKEVLLSTFKHQSNPDAIENVKKILRDDLVECDVEQVATFRKYALEPHFAPILRYGEFGNVVVVARKGDEVIYWEDIEEGFNLSPIAPDGRILEHWCNQDALRFALNGWITGRVRPVRLSPAKPIE